MQVRDLIEALQRFDPRAEVQAEVKINATWTEPRKVVFVNTEAGEPVLVCE